MSSIFQLQGESHEMHFSFGRGKKVQRNISGTVFFALSPLSGGTVRFRIASHKSKGSKLKGHRSSSWRRDTPFWPSCRDLRQRYPRRSSASGLETFDPIFCYDPSLPSGAPWWPWLYNLEPDGGCCLSCVLRTYLACLSQSFPPPLWSVPERSFPGFGGRCRCTIETSPFRVQCLKATGGPCSFSDRNRP